MTSVVIATYNGEKYIEEQLDSIRKQSISPDEVIIVDDCSKDKTVKIIESFLSAHRLRNWKLIKNDKNLGYTLNFYHGIKQSSGDLVYLSDQDDSWHMDKLEVMTQYMNQNKEVMVLSSRYNLIDANGVRLIKNPGVVNYVDKFDGTIQLITLESLIGVSYIRGCSMCFRKEIIRLIPNISLNNLLGHDWMINVLGAMIGQNHCINMPLFDYRVHSTNVSLSAISRDKLIGSRTKRLVGLKESIVAHDYIIKNQEEFSNISQNIVRRIRKQISFEKKRLLFLEDKRLIYWFQLLCYLAQYRRYYQSMLGGIKIWIGDLLYAYNINFKIK